MGVSRTGEDSGAGILAYTRFPISYSLLHNPSFTGCYEICQVAHQFGVGELGTERFQALCRVEIASEDHLVGLA